MFETITILISNLCCVCYCLSLLLNQCWSGKLFLDCSSIIVSV